MLRSIRDYIESNLTESSRLIKNESSLNRNDANKSSFESNRHMRESFPSKTLVLPF